MDNTVMRFSAQGFETFVAALDAPGKPVPEMVSLLMRPAPWSTTGAG